MAGILDPGDAMIPSRKLNDVNDPSPGSIVATSNVSGSIIQPFSGQVGKRLVCSTSIASKLSDTAIGTLLEGIYQYVQVASTSAAVARGTLVYWQNYESCIVTATPSAADVVLGGSNAGLVAGVALNTVTVGNYCYIQIAGKANIKFKTTITKGSTVAAGDLVLADGTTSARADVIPDASSLTPVLGKLILGVAIATPTSNGISTVDLWNLRQVMQVY